MTESIKRIIKRLETATVLLIVFIVPVFFAFFLKTNNAFELNKIVIFRILVLFLLWLNLYKILFFNNFFIKKYKFSKDKLFVCSVLILFLLSLIISTIFSVDYNTSFFGQYDKQEGLFSYLFYILFFFLLLDFFKDKENIKKVLWSSVLSSFLVSLYAVLQANGIDFFKWTESTSLRVTSTLGQPNHLASYLLFVLPVSFYLAFKTKNKLLKIIPSVIFLMQIIAFFYTYSIASWLGMFVSLVVFIILFLIYSFGKIFTKKTIKILLVISPIVILFVVLLGANLNFQTIKNKFVNLTEFSTGSTAVRLQFWKASLKAIKEKPVFGYGLDTQQEALVRKYQKDWAIHSNVNVMPTRAHNWALDILITQGILGLLAHFLLWIWIFKILIKNIRQQNELAFSYTLLGIFLSYFVYLQFNYHHVTTNVSFWFLIAIIFSINKANDIQKNDASVEPALKSKRNQFVALIIFIFITIGIFYLVDKEFNKISADHYFMEIRKASLKNQYIIALDMYALIKDIDFNLDVYDKKFVSIMYNWEKRLNNDLFYNMINQRFEKILPNLKQNNFSDVFARALIYDSFGHEDENKFQKARKEFKELAILSPEIPKVHRLYADFLLETGDYNEAIYEYNLAISKTPKLNSFGLNKEHEFAIKRELDLNYQGLTKAYEALGETEKKMEYESKAKELEN